MRIIWCATFFCTIFIFPLRAQFDADNLIAGNLEDMEYLSHSYLRPLGDAVVSSLNNGWYNTAKLRKLARVDFSLNTTVLKVPSQSTLFQIDSEQLTRLRVADAGQTSSSTFFGDRGAGAHLEPSDTGFGNMGRFSLPGGTGLPYFLMAQAQASIGIGFGTEVKLRYLPPLENPLMENTRLQLYGLGIQYDITKCFPASKLLPIRASLFGGVNYFSFSQSLGDSRSLELSSLAYTLRVVASAKILFITVYGGYGYNYGQTDFGLLGNYRYFNPQTGQNEMLSDPVAMDFRAYEDWVGNLGVRIKMFWLLYLSADYSFGQFEAITASLGASIDF